MEKLDISTFQSIIGKLSGLFQDDLRLDQKKTSNRLLLEKLLEGISSFSQLLAGLVYILFDQLSEFQLEDFG